MQCLVREGLCSAPQNAPAAAPSPCTARGVCRSVGLGWKAGAAAELPGGFVPRGPPWALPPEHADLGTCRLRARARVLAWARQTGLRSSGECPGCVKRRESRGPTCWPGLPGDTGPRVRSHLARAARLRAGMHRGSLGRGCPGSIPGAPPAAAAASAGMGSKELSPPSWGG